MPPFWFVGIFGPKKLCLHPGESKLSPKPANYRDFPIEETGRMFHGAGSNSHHRFHGRRLNGQDTQADSPVDQARSWSRQNCEKRSRVAKKHEPAAKPWTVPRDDTLAPNTKDPAMRSQADSRPTGLS